MQLYKGKLYNLRLWRIDISRGEVFGIDAANDGRIATFHSDKFQSAFGIRWEKMYFPRITGK